MFRPNHGRDLLEGEAFRLTNAPDVGSKPPGPIIHDKLLTATNTGTHAFQADVAARVTLGLTANGAYRNIGVMTVYTRLRAMKQREAAALIGVSRPFVAQILNRARQPSAETLAKISARLQLTDEEIGASVREMFPEPFADQPDAA